MELALAVDIGATKTAVGVVDARGAIIHRAEVATPVGGSAEETWAAVAEPVRAAHARYAGKLTGAGIGSAGPVDVVAGTISPNMIPAWRGFPVVERVGELTDGLPVRLLGDGTCATIGEHWAGAGRGVANLLGMVVSSGVGGGLVLGGRVRTGPTGNAGHVGHVVVDPGGGECVCGGRGCVETLASGPSMVDWAGKEGWCPRGPATGVALAAAARAGDPVAQAAFARGARAIAAMIVSLAAACDLDLAVLGGGVAQAGDVLFTPLRSALAEHAGLAFTHRVAAVPAGLGVHAGLVGAAALVHRPSAYAVG